jgi:hypothetical protein
MTTFIPSLTAARLAALATGPLGIVGAGLALGGAGAEIIRRKQVASGDKLAPGSFGEMAGNAWARIRNVVTFADYDLNVTGQDGLTDSQRKAKMQEQAALKAASASSSAAVAAMPAAVIGIPGMAGADTGATTDIEALEDQLRAETDKDKKKALQNRLFYARRAERHGKQAEATEKRTQTKAEREEAKVQREAERDAGYGATATSAEAGAAFDTRAAGVRTSSETADFRDKLGLKRAIRGVRSDKRAGALDEESASSKITALQSAYDARNKAREADLEMQLAQINSQKELAEAGAKASTETGARAASILRVGRAAAERILAIGKAKAEMLREEAIDLREEAAEALRNVTGGAANPRTIAAEFAAKRLAASRDYTQGADSGSMLKIGSGTYTPTTAATLAGFGGGRDAGAGDGIDAWNNGAATGAFVGNDALMRMDGVARASAAIGGYGRMDDGGLFGAPSRSSGIPTLRPKGRAQQTGNAPNGNLQFRVSFADVDFELPPDSMMAASEAIR